MDQAAFSKFQTATLLRHTVLASTYHYFDFAPSKPLFFIPGQYISVKVASEQNNAYSIAGHHGYGRFNLLVDIKPGGAGSKFFEKIQVGEQINFLGPFGQFTLRENDGARQLLFMATGCGLSPLKCMIESALYEKNIQLPIMLYFGLSTSQDLFGQGYLQKISQDHPNFSYKIAIWKPDSSWQGPVGFITQFLKTDFPKAYDVAAYLCGNPAMIADATKMLIEQGCPATRIYTEKY